MTEPREWDIDYRPPRSRIRPEVIDAEYRLVSTRRQALSFGTALFITTVAMAVIIRFAWAPLLMGAVMLGIYTPGEMVAVVAGLTIILAASLHSRFNRRPF